MLALDNVVVIVVDFFRHQTTFNISIGIAYTFQLESNMNCADQEID